MILIDINSNEEYDVILIDMENGKDITLSYITYHYGEVEKKYNTVQIENASLWANYIKERYIINMWLYLLKYLIPMEIYNKIEFYVNKLIDPSNLETQSVALDFIQTSLHIYLNKNYNTLKILSELDKKIKTYIN